jgi:hypothetical protein
MAHYGVKNDFKMLTYYLYALLFQSFLSCTARIYSLFKQALRLDFLYLLAYISIMKRILLVLFLVSSLYACDSGVEWKDSPYEVMWIDTRNNRTLNHTIDENASIGRVDAEVIAVGSNAKYVVAKQRSIGRDSVSYFYIDKTKDDMYLNGNEITQGPFSEDKFFQLKIELGLPEFSKAF